MWRSPNTCCVLPTALTPVMVIVIVMVFPADNEQSLAAATGSRAAWVDLYGTRSASWPARCPRVSRLVRDAEPPTAIRWSLFMMLLLLLLQLMPRIADSRIHCSQLIADEEALFNCLQCKIRNNLSLQLKTQITYSPQSAQVLLGPTCYRKVLYLPHLRLLLYIQTCCTDHCNIIL